MLIACGMVRRYARRGGFSAKMKCFPYSSEDEVIVVAGTLRASHATSDCFFYFFVAEDQTVQKRIEGIW